VVSTSAESYARLAGAYDWLTGAFQAFRRDVVELLDPAPGAVVIDIGCGTGLCFALLEERIGRRGWIVGIDQSPEMLRRAERRVRARGWDNVVLIAAPAEAAEIPLEADAALFCATHDILRSPLALKNVLAHVRPGGRVAAAGGKWAPPAMIGLNLAVGFLHAPYVSTFEGFDQPWSHLAVLVDDLTVTEVAAGTGYLAAGTTPA
jgi:SAM-dependent methyltransferase